MEKNRHALERDDAGGSDPDFLAGGKIRLFVEEDLTAGQHVVLDPDQSHYLARVMRVKLGDALALFNGRDGEWLGEVAQAGKKSVTVALERRTRAQGAEPDLWLLFAPIKRARLDYMAQKATEMGVSGLAPVFTRRTAVTRVNQERLAANAREAAEQSGRLAVPGVFEARALDAWLGDWPSDRRLIFCDEALPGEGSASAVETLTALAKKGRGKPHALLIGPEGGFDEGERAALRAHASVTSLPLGPRILRADTAAVAALTLWQAHLGDW